MEKDLEKWADEKEKDLADMQALVDALESGKVRDMTEDLLAEYRENARIFRKAVNAQKAEQK